MAWPPVRMDAVAAIERSRSAGATRASAAAWAGLLTLAPVAVTLVGLLLRLHRLDGRSVWLDEAFSARAAGFSNLNDLITWVQSDFDQMPAFAVGTWLLRGAGTGEFVLRLPSAVAGTLCIPAVFWLARHLFDRSTALIAAALTAIMPYALWYSQEARPYALLMLATTVQMTFAYRALTSNRVKDWVGVVLSTTLVLYTHYMGLAATAAMAVYLSLNPPMVCNPLAGEGQRGRRGSGWSGLAA